MRRVPEATRLYRWLALGSAALATGIGVTGLLGWAVPSFPLPGQREPTGPVRPETSAALTVAGVALILLVGSPGPARRRAGHAMGAVTAILGLLGIADRLGIETTNLLAPRHLIGGDAVHAPELSPAAASALLLGGLSLVVIDAPARRWLAWSQAFALAAAAISLVTVLAYFFEAIRSGPGLATLVAMPPASATGVLILAVGVIVARPGHGLLQPFSSRGPDGALARRLIPTLALVPFGVVLLATVVIRLWHGTPALALALSTALFLVIVVLVLSGTLRIIDEAAARRDHLLDQLAAERDFTATLLYSLCEAVVVFDRDLRVIDVNPRAVEVLGLSRDSLVGQCPPYSWQADGQQVPPLPGHAGPAGLDSTHGAHGRVGPDSGGGSDLLVRHPDGSLVPVLARMSAVLDQERRPRAYVGTFVDIADRKRAEDTLAEHATELERANDQLRRGNQQLTEAAEFKRDLMSLVSHELSQPLSSIASLAELLASDWTDLPDETRLELTQKIDNNARRLTRMIHDMVLLFRLDAGTVSARRESVPIGEVVDTVADAAPDTAQIVTSVDPDLCALVDRGHLWQMLSNLVHNAMAHGEPPIEISAERDADGVVVSVRDYGEGIAEEHLPHLFDRVSPRGSRGGRRGRGSGLGLFIVRHLVEVNGGTIWYEHADPCGARLGLRLEPATPRADRPRVPAGPAATSPGSAPSTGREPAGQPAGASADQGTSAAFGARG